MHAWLVTMEEGARFPRLIRFAEYQLDSRTGELRKGDTVLRLQKKPLQILLLLLDRPGEVVTREELRITLWPDHTFVDFEDSLNHAVRRLREALDESSANPRLVQTLRGLGYRFIAPVGARQPPGSTSDGRRVTVESPPGSGEGQTLVEAGRAPAGPQATAASHTASQRWAQRCYRGTALSRWP
jgi:DNA-binding winged helix-turn-helix (wHTH) protein